jgi:hypothetical protein
MAHSIANDPQTDIGLVVCLTCRLRLGKFPFAAQDFGVRAIEPYRIVLPLGDWQTVRHLAVASTELDRNGAIAALLGRKVIERVRIVSVFLEVAVRVVTLTDQKASLPNPRRGPYRDASTGCYTRSLSEEISVEQW